MELQQLRYVLAVAEERSFTRAAERCHIVQSAMSHQIKALEREIGVQLFARTSRRVELTDAGAAFLPAARASLEAADRAIADAAAANGELRGSLTIGVIPTVTAIDIPAALGRFRRAHAAVRIRLRGGGSDEFITAISEGAMDVAVLGLPDSVPPQGVASRELARERLVVVVNRGHRLLAQGTDPPLLRLADLAGETFVDFPAGAPGRVPSDLAFRAAGITRDVAFEAMGIDVMLDLVRNDLAVALLPPRVVPADGSVAIFEIADGPTRIEYLAWSSFNVSHAALAFLETLAD